MAMTVKIIKLISLQEVIARVVTETELELHVESPLAIQPMRTGETSMSLGLVPFSWAGNNKETITLNKAHILCVMNPEEDLKTQYIAALSGIALPNGGATPKLTLTE